MILSQSRHGGDIFKLPGGERDVFLDFSININPLGLSPKGKEALIRSWEKEVLRYPDMECRELISALANRYGMPDRMITVGNGATEIMYTLLRVLLPGKVYVPAPSFSEYRLSAESVNAKVEEIPLSAKTDFKIPVEFFTKIEPKSVVYLGNPNNPDGQILNEERLKQILPLVEKTQSYLILDESFVDFLGDSFSYRKLCLCHRQVIIVSSLTKFYAVPGLRIGCSFSTEEIAYSDIEKSGWSSYDFADDIDFLIVMDNFENLFFYLNGEIINSFTFEFTGDNNKKIIVIVKKM